MCILLGQVFIFGHLSVFGYLVICIFERYFVYLSVYSLGGFVVLENVLEDNELGRFLIKVNTRARRLTFRTREDAIYVTIPPGTTLKKIKNAIEDYSKDTNVPSSKKMYESSLEGGAKAIGTKVIDKYANAVCRKFTQSATGGYVGYVAVHVLLEDAKKGLAEELEVRKVDYDKKKFFEKMDKELAASAAKQKEEVDAMK